MINRLAKPLLLLLVILLMVPAVAYAEEAAPDGRVRLTGEISALGATGFTLTTGDGRAIVVSVDDETKFRILNGANHGFDQLEPGMQALVVGLPQAEGSVLARMVAAGYRRDLPEDRLKVRGAFSAIHLERSAFAFKTSAGEELYFLVSDRTHFRSADGSIQGLKDLEKGMLGAVLALPNDEGVLQALLVVVFPEAKIKRAYGVIRHIDLQGSLFSLLAGDQEMIGFEVVERTRFTSPDGSVQGLADLAPGMPAVVSYVNTDEGRIALGVAVRTKAETFRHLGEIINVVAGRSYFTLRTRQGDEVTIFVDERTRFRSPDGEVEDIHDLKKGMAALVSGFVGEEGQLQALVVAVSEELPQLKAAGKIRKLGARSFVLETLDGRLIELAVNQDTIYRSSDGSLKTFADLRVGMTVAVGARQQADGGWQAKLVAARAPRSEGEIRPPAEGDSSDRPHTDEQPGEEPPASEEVETMSS